ncbi:hypothetical protein WMY93_012608 [Mugilogobius chulae]|uniref:Uncharacterized protein n=1 Tax=Mugilogobius chulae TaxID=88201 RepID=A0AAW0P7Q2_9GOBI
MREGNKGRKQGKERSQARGGVVCLFSELWRRSFSPSENLCLQKPGDGPCPGEARLYKICNTKSCPAGSEDFRELQCRAFNHRPLLSGSTFTWMPFHSGSNPCELSCLAEGHRFYLNFGKVLDGTSCGADPGSGPGSGPGPGSDPGSGSSPGSDPGPGSGPGSGLESVCVNGRCLDLLGPGPGPESWSWVLVPVLVLGPGPGSWSRSWVLVQHKGDWRVPGPERSDSPGPDRGLWTERALVLGVEPLLLHSSGVSFLCQNCLWFLWFMVPVVHGSCGSWFLWFMVPVVHGSSGSWFLRFMVPVVMVPVVHGSSGSWFLWFMVPVVHGSCGSWFLWFMVPQVNVPVVHGSCGSWFLRLMVPVVHGSCGSWCSSGTVSLEPNSAPEAKLASDC